MNKPQDREYITVIAIHKGIIRLIEPDGTVGFYRQRGIQRLPPNVIAKAIEIGELDPRWEQVKELPRNWSISYEDEEIMGRAYATYPIYSKYIRKSNKNGK